MTLRELDDREERGRALRALLGAPFVGADEPAYALIRRHERELATALQVTYGYQLEVGSTAARAAGLPTPGGLLRPLRIKPVSVSGRKRPPQELEMTWLAVSAFKSPHNSESLDGPLLPRTMTSFSSIL